MTAKILDTKKDPISVKVLENNAKRYIFQPYISFNISFLWHGMPYLSPLRCPKVLFGPFRWQKSFSVFSKTP